MFAYIELLQRNLVDKTECFGSQVKGKSAERAGLGQLD